MRWNWSDGRAPTSTCNCGVTCGDMPWRDARGRIIAGRQQIKGESAFGVAGRGVARASRQVDDDNRRLRECGCRWNRRTVPRIDPVAESWAASEAGARIVSKKRMRAETRESREDMRPPLRDVRDRRS